jgi:hypothetical protein
MTRNTDLKLNICIAYLPNWATILKLVTRLYPKTIQDRAKIHNHFYSSYSKTYTHYTVNVKFPLKKEIR